MKESYLGDGLYGSYDGYQFKLRAPREFGDHEVYLDFTTFKSFMRLVEEKLSVNVNIVPKDSPDADE